MRRSLFWLLDQYPETHESVSSVHECAMEQSIEADRLGFHSLWLAEHHFLHVGTVPNPAVLLAAIAQRTARLRLGPAIAVLPLRNPIHVAEDYALVDMLSDGRLNMGVGAGSNPVEFTPFEIDFECRRELFADSLSCLRDRWTRSTSGTSGPESLNVAPRQKPTPPIYVATRDEGIAYQIGRDGDSMLTIVSPTLQGVDEPAARVRAHARGLSEREIADDRAESVMMMFAHVAETEQEVRATVVPALARLMLAMSGSPLPDAEAFFDQMRENGVGLFGTPSQVDQQLQRLTDLEVHHVAFISRFGGMPREKAMQSLRLLAPEVVPEAALSHGRSQPETGLRTAAQIGDYR